MLWQQLRCLSANMENLGGDMGPGHSPKKTENQMLSKVAPQSQYLMDWAPVDQYVNSLLHLK